ncbi:MAG: type II secretion system minor pseudopilin GspK [Pseudomonadota bacterium]
MRARGRNQSDGRRQRGVAMVVALMMTATLSFLALSVSEKMRASARRTILSADRSELYWRAISAETLAREALADLQQTSGAAGAANVQLTLTSPFFLAPVDIPMPDGLASLQFADAGRCFNLNSLAGGGARARANEPDNGDGDSERDDGAQDRGEGSDRQATPRAEFIELLTLLGLSDGDSARLTSTIVDWIDPDDVTSLNGAEDDFYSNLPAPFRTGGAPLADVSELRAMRGFDEVVYQGLRPFACALPHSEPTVLNVNMLRAQDLPVLAAIISSATEARVDPQDLMSVLEARPPEGWSDVQSFWSDPALAEYEVPEAIRGARTTINSRMIEARAIVGRNGVEVTVTLTFQAEDDGTYTLLSRVFGEAG